MSDKLDKPAWQEEDSLLTDITANQPLEDREPFERRIHHVCGHYSNARIWGEYRKEDRFQFMAKQNCPVCMMYKSALHCFGFTHKNFGRGKNTGLVSLEAMMNVADWNNIHG